jgi:type II secretion system protein I
MSAARARGFTLLEVLIAVAILSTSLTSLLRSQMDSMRATRYAQGVTAAVFLAEFQLQEIEWIQRRDGWAMTDRKFEGTFGEQGWPDTKYDCLVDFIELPEYSALARANDANRNMQGTYVAKQKDKAFSALGMVWTIIKKAIEQSIRKASCTVRWKDGKIEHDFTVETFWTDPAKLASLPAPGAGGGPTPGGDDDEGSDRDGGSKGGGGGARPPGSAPGTRPSVGGVGK